MSSKDINKPNNISQISEENEYEVINIRNSRFRRNEGIQLRQSNINTRSIEPEDTSDNSRTAQVRGPVPLPRKRMSVVRNSNEEKGEINDDSDEEQSSYPLNLKRMPERKLIASSDDSNAKFSESYLKNAHNYKVEPQQNGDTHKQVRTSEYSNNSDKDDGVTRTRSMIRRPEDSDVILRSSLLFNNKNDDELEKPIGNKSTVLSTEKHVAPLYTRPQTTLAPCKLKVLTSTVSIYEPSSVLTSIRNKKSDFGEDESPPPLPTRRHSQMWPSGTRSISSNSEQDNWSRATCNLLDSDADYVLSYPPRIGYLSITETDVGDAIRSKYNEAFNLLLTKEKSYLEILKEIYKSYKESAEYDNEDYIKSLFGEIRNLLEFHTSFIRDFTACDTLPELGKVIRRKESEFDVYIRDKWLKSKVVEPKTTEAVVLLRYRNWAETHLSLYAIILRQLETGGDPDVKVASSIISDLIEQCKAVDFLSKIQNFPEIQKAGKYVIKSLFRVKLNNMDKDTCEVILMEKYIICISIESKKCLYKFNTSEVTASKKDSKTLYIENSDNKSEKMILKSSETSTLETWYNRLLSITHKKNFIRSQSVR